MDDRSWLQTRPRRSSSVGPDSPDNINAARPRSPASSPVRGIRKSSTSNIYLNLSSPRNMRRSYSNDPGLRHAGPSGPLHAVAHHSPSPSRRPRLSTHSNPRPGSSYSYGSPRKSVLSTATSRNSDGSGSISIRYPSGFHGSSPFRSFSAGASDFLADGANDDDDSSEVLNDDPFVGGVALQDHSPSIPATAIIEQSRRPTAAVEPATDSNNNHPAAAATNASNRYSGVSRFYYNTYESNYNSSEEEVDDDSSVYSAVPITPPIELELEEPTSEGSDILAPGLRRMLEEQDANNALEEGSSDLDYDDNGKGSDDAQVIERDSDGQYRSRRLLRTRSEDFGLDENSFDTDAEYTQFPFASDAGPDYSQHIPDFDADNSHAMEKMGSDMFALPDNEAPKSGAKLDTENNPVIVHPVYPGIEPNQVIYREREITDEQERGSESGPKKAMVPVYMETLALSTFPYVNSLAPFSAMLQQLPRGQYATTMSAGAIGNHRDSRISAILPPLPTRESILKFPRSIASRFSMKSKPCEDNAQSQVADESKSRPAESPVARRNVEPARPVPSGGPEDPMDFLIQLENGVGRFQHDSMFEFKALEPPALVQGRANCPESIGAMLLVVFVLFPPMWLVMGFGGLDSTFGEISRTQKIVARTLGLCLFTAAIAGIVIGLAVGLT
ncbi:uncharacterized protein V1516DRAFT_678564 [Lipomyces oligophaga]|uniref:uncharacterized protein n=1 Tax=Lipomyces oligophaga TaxID=45792 RepID=UPI0034CEB0A6